MLFILTTCHSNIEQGILFVVNNYEYYMYSQYLLTFINIDAACQPNPVHQTFMSIEHIYLLWSDFRDNMFAP